MTTETQSAEQHLETLSPEELRPILSRLSVKTPGVLYYGLPFKASIQGLPVKTTTEGNKMNPLGQAMMFSAVAASELLDVGDTLKTELTSVQHGDLNVGSFEVLITRVED